MDLWLANKNDEYKKKPEDQLYGTLVNNIHGWVNVPEGTGSFYGAKRTPTSMSYYAENPEQLEEITRLIKDVDTYIKANNLGDFVYGLAKQQGEHMAAFNEMVRTRNPKVVENLKDVITEGEMLEFKKDLYYAMRRKGHSGVLLRT